MLYNIVFLMLLGSSSDNTNQLDNQLTKLSIIEELKKELGET